MYACSVKRNKPQVITIIIIIIIIIIFTVCMVPLTKILQDDNAGYTLGDVKINHLFFMDDLKVYGKDKAEIESLVSIVQLIGQAIGMEFGIKKSGVVVLKQAKLLKVRVLS